MDVALDMEDPMAVTQNVVLSYDDVTPIEEYTESQALEHSATEETGSISLAARIGTTKAYFMPEAGANRAGKRKHDDEEEEAEDVNNIEDSDIPSNTSIRENALLLNGTPISHLPTNNIFAYATHFDTKPTALEWIDDTTCILVFPTRASARTAYNNLSKSKSEDALDNDCITAHPIPVAIWPPEDRINSSLGKGEGLKGTIHLRWATPWDVKQKGAKQQSGFYKRYGQSARHDGPGEEPAGKRRRRDVDKAEQKAELDQELDSFLTADPEDAPPSPPSKMRSDRMPSSGRTLLERFRPSDLQSRLSQSHSNSRSKMRGFDEGAGEKRSSRDSFGERTERNGRGRRGEEKRSRTARPKKTAEDLDAELDSFLKEGNNQD